MNQRLVRTFVVAGAVLALFFSSSLLLARQGVLKTRDGKTLEGDIAESPDQVIITIHGIKTTVARDNINGPIEYFDNIEARYQAKLAALPKKPSVADHMALARWLFDVKSYELALKEIDEVRKLDANNADAQTLEQTIMSQRRLEKTHPAAGTGTGTPATGTGAPATGTKPPADKKFLSAEDINTIRQMEWRKDDQTVPRVTVPVDVRRRFVDMKALDPGNFASLTMPEQAYFILIDTKVPEDMKKEIKITTDPQAMTEFRRNIQPLVTNNCATTGCHGGHNSGEFFLFNNNIERDEVAYTNFYILQNFKNEKGEFAMVDRTYPDRALLAQFALKPDAAELKHPEIKGQTYKPISPNKSGKGYKDIVAWMKGLQSGDPNYGVKYDLPTSSPKKEAPAPDAPKTDAPKTDAPKTDAPKTDAPKTDAPKTSTPATEAPKTNAPKTNTPKTDAPANVPKPLPINIQPPAGAGNANK